MSARVLLRFVATSVLLATLVGAVGCMEQGGVKVTSMTFNGLEAVTAGQLKSVLATGPSSKIPWGEKRYFSREQFEADLKRIAAFYHDRGYPDARVASFDVKLNAEQTAVAIVLNVSEGEPVVVERVDLTGFDALRPIPRARLEAALPLKAGQPVDRALLQASREAALDRLKDSGYPYATVKLAEAPGSSERRHVVTLAADIGPLTRHGALDIQGNSSVSDHVIQRQLTFKPGDIFRQSKLLESQRKLYALEVFQFANVQPAREEGEKPLEIPTRITVTEGKHRRVNFSLGYGTEEKGRVEGDWRHVNFFGGARTVGVRARYSGLDRGVRLEFKQPYLWSPRFTLGLQGQMWHNDEPDRFTLDNIGGKVSITRELGRAGGRVFSTRPAATLALSYANEFEDFTIDPRVIADFSQRDDLIALGLDPTQGGVGSGQRSSLGFDGGRNTTDNLLDAKRGYMAAVHLEHAGSFLGGDYHYKEVTAEGRYYLSVAGKAVLAVRARAGSIDPSGGDLANVPFYKRYFLGGATNLRGWGRFDVAPLSGFGLPIGGHTFTNFSTEIRVPVWRQLGAVLFVDGGNVWTNPWDFNLKDMHYDLGPGLRYNTPIGPIRADFGYQLDRIDGLLVNGQPEPRRFRFHFSIGQAF